MEKNYDLTPSFFNNQETFEKYLGQTSDYKVLQEAMKKLCSLGWAILDIKF